MNTSRKLALLLVLLVTAAVATADTITSTNAGGPWFAPATWVGGAVPAADDDVVIAGAVAIAGAAACANLFVLPEGAVVGAVVAPPRSLHVAGAVDNLGAVGAINGFYLDLEIGGDLHNDGVWSPAVTRLVGGADRQLSQTPGRVFATRFSYAAGASGDLIATTPISLAGEQDFSAGRLVLQPACPLTLDGAVLRGNVLGGGNELRFVSWSYLIMCTLDDVVLVGEAKASFAVTVTTRLTVMDVLQNGGTGGGGSVTVEGDLVNHGLIRNVQYSFPVRVTGDVENNGTIDCPQLELLGVGAVHRLRMSPDAVLSTPVFLPEFQAATLIAETPVRFGDGLGLGIGTLILEPDCSLEFTNFGGLGSGTVLAGGNVISISGSGALSGAAIDQAVIGHQLVVSGENTFTGGLTVSGTITSWPWNSADLTVEGLLRNDGLISDGAHPVRLRVLGDLANHGAFTNARVVLAGAVDQAVGTGPQGLAVGQFVLESGLQAAAYQWYRDGVALPGETAADLILAGVDNGDHGTYHCEADGQLSRAVVIAETITTTDVPAAAATVTLEPNHPNPFNPATTIAFTLSAPTPVSLAVHDLAGHLIDQLFTGELAAGRHEFRWQPDRIPSGLYVYHLRAGASELSRTCTLLK